MAFEHYIQTGGRRLRCGYTTGTCAALAAAGCARFLVSGDWPGTVSLRTPKGMTVEVPLEGCRTEGAQAVCAVRKDGGDDVDGTHNALIQAGMTLTDRPGILIEGGRGVGRVTKPGLDQPVGSAAINRVPRQMITRAVEDILSAAGHEGGAKVVISVPEGEAIAKQTFNPRLGIEGGISILGTSGIVEPMSTRAIVDTIALELRQAALDSNRLILIPGNYGLDYVKKTHMDMLDVPVVKCSNYIGEALDEAVLDGFQEILLVGHIGKLEKLAGGIFNTHSRTADCRAELFCAHAALQGADRSLCRKIMDSPTADACLTVLDKAGLRGPVLDSLLGAMQAHLTRRAGPSCSVGAVVFSNEYGLLGVTRQAEECMETWQRSSKADSTE